MANYKGSRGEMGNGFLRKRRVEGKNVFTVSVYIHLSSLVVSTTYTPSGLKAWRQPPPITLLVYDPKVVPSFEMFSNRDPLNFDFRNGAKNSAHLNHPLQRYGQIYFKIFRYISEKAGWLRLAKRYIKNKNLFCERYALDYVWPSLVRIVTLEPPQKNVSFRKCHFSRT